MHISYSKHIFVTIVVGTLIACSNVYPNGAITHPYLAKLIYEKLGETDKDIHSIVENNLNDYLVGSDYPDTGYVPGVTYGKYSGNHRFVDAFLTYLQETYPTSSPRRDRLLAFLMGIATHVQVDKTSHSRYYSFVAEKDFDNQPDPGTARRMAEKYMDPGMDFYVIVKKHVYNHPVEWWVPVKDLVAVYSCMEEPTSTEEIIKGNVIYYFATGIDETLIALPAFLYDSYIAVPWGMSNLENPEPIYGAFPAQIDESVEYVRKVWAIYNGVSKLELPESEIEITPWVSPAIPFVESAFDTKLLDTQVTLDSEGDLVVTPQDIVTTDKYEKEKETFLGTLGLDTGISIKHLQ